jgi:hypothetical protein
MKRVLAPLIATVLALPAPAFAHEDEAAAAAEVPSGVDLGGIPEEPGELVPPAAVQPIEAVAGETVEQGPTVEVEASSDLHDADPPGPRGDGEETTETGVPGEPEVAASGDAETETPAPEPDPEGDELDRRMKRTGVGMIALGSALALTSAGLATGARITRKKVRTRAYDGIEDGTESSEPREDPSELRRREELLDLAPRLRRGAAITGIPAAVFVTTGVIMLAFAAADEAERKASQRVRLRASLSPMGGSASLVAGF